MKSPFAALALLAVVSILCLSGAASANDRRAAADAARNAGGELVDLPLPANWQRKQAGDLFMYVRPADPESGLKTIFRLKPEPKTGTLAQTYLSLWTQTIHGLFPNEPLQNHMVPLVIRNSKGVCIAFDGDSLQKNPLSVMLYLVDIGNEVVPFIGMFASEPMAAAITAATSAEPSLPATEIAHAFDQISLATMKSSSEPMFDPTKLVGAYYHTGVASMATFRSNSGANRGDASTGRRDDIEFKADGAYTEQSVLVVLGRAQGVETRQGKWTLAGFHLTVHFTDGESPDKTWLLMGLGTNRRGTESLAYLIDPKFTDKWFIEMFRQGANMNTYYFTKKR
jgi:hypothetical protein